MDCQKCGRVPTDADHALILRVIERPQAVKPTGWICTGCRPEGFPADGLCYSVVEIVGCPATNYERQLAMTETLALLSERIGSRASRHAYADSMLARARAQRRDFYTLVAADVIGIDYCDVTDFERWAAKTALLPYVLAGPGGKVMHIQDTAIVENPRAVGAASVAEVVGESPEHEYGG